MPPDSSKDVAVQLKAIPIFRRLGREDQVRLAEVASLREYARGESVFREGESATCFVAIASGRVKIAKLTPSGKDVIIEILGTGDPVGAVAVYEGRPFPASAIAIEDTTCVQLPRDAFFALLEKHPSMVRGLLAGLTLRLVDLTNRLAELTGGRVEPRFAQALREARAGAGPEGT